MKTGRKKAIRSFFLLLLVTMLLCSTFINTYAADAEVRRPLRKVRVGYLTYEGYQEGKGDEPKSGYGYEYLQRIAYYAGWEYEYVNGTFNELLEMLKRGEIDIMGNLSYTEDRAKDILFAKEEQGREYYYLVVREDRIDIDAADPTTLQGARVGINKGSIQVKLFQKWCQDNGVECQIELYESSQKRYEDMNSGKLDAMVSTTLAEKELSRYHWNAILKVGYSSYYFGMSKKDPALYAQLNSAIAQILQTDWYYNEKVYLKYNGKTSSASAGLNAADMAWMKEKGVMRIGYMDDSLPYADWAEKEGRMIGLLSTFLSHLRNRYDATVEAIKYESYDAMVDALRQGRLDAIFPTYGSFWVAEENQMMVTDPLTSGYLMMIYQGSFDEQTTSVIAVADRSPLQMFYVREHYPESEILRCDDTEACLKAVSAGKATCTLICSDTYYAYRNEYDHLSDFVISNTGFQVPVSFAVRRDDTRMYRFLQKGLSSIMDADIHEALIAGDYANPELSVQQFFQKHVFLLTVIFGVVLMLVVTLFFYYVISTRRTLRLSRHNSELSEKAYLDLATGLPNKNRCEEMLSSHMIITRPTAFFMLDLNDLKKVNDSLGHEMGDLMILNFGKLLRNVVPIRYFVGRFGGDEFIVIAEGISGREEAEHLVADIKEMMMIFNGARGEFQLNYACGFAFSGDYPGATASDLLNEADIKMYEDKARTKAELARI